MSSTTIKTLKFLGPHLLSMLEEAVKRWNHEIPIEMAEEANNHFKLLSSKMPVNIEVNVEKVDVSPSDFYNLFTEVKDWVCKEYYCVIRDAVRSVVHDDEMKSYESGKHALSFSTWISQGESFSGDKIVGDAILCLQRMNPARQIAPSGTLFLRDPVKVIHINPSSHDVEQMREKLGLMYDFKYHRTYFSHNLLELRPLHDYVDISVLNKAYGVEFQSLSSWSLMTLDTDQKWLDEDPNLSKSGIMNKVVGSSITSLSTVLSDVLIWMCLFFDDIPDLSSRLSFVRSSAWDSVNDILDFARPDFLFESANRGNRGERLLLRDFRRLETLLELYQVYMSLGISSVIGPLPPTAPVAFEEPHVAHMRTFTYDDNLMEVLDLTVDVVNHNVHNDLNNRGQWGVRDGAAERISSAKAVLSKLGSTGD